MQLSHFFIRKLERLVFTDHFSQHFFDVQNLNQLVIKVGDRGQIRFKG